LKEINKSSLEINQNQASNLVMHCHPYSIQNMEINKTGLKF